MREEHEAKIKALQEALIAGEDSGPSRLFDSEEFLKSMRAKYGHSGIDGHP